MSPERSNRPRSKRRVDHAEEQAWVSFYRRVGNSAIASEVMQQLDADPEMKRQHLALYLRCKESLRMQKARLARNKRIGQFVRMLASALFVAPAHAVHRLFARSSEVALECLPEVPKEPAARQVRSLTREAEFKQEQSQFGSEAAAEAAKQANASSSAMTAT